MNKFISNLVKHNSSIRDERARRLAKSVEFAQTDLINNLIKRKMELEDKIESMLDFNPTSTTDLTVGNKNFNADEFVNQMYTARVELSLLKEKIKIAKEFSDEYFTEQKNEVLSNSESKE